MDYEFLTRVQNKLNEYLGQQMSVLLSTKDNGDARSAQGAIRACSVFREILVESNGQHKPEETSNVEQSQYNI